MGIKEWFAGPTPIAKLKEKHDAPSLESALVGSDLRRREEAAAALGELNDPATVPALGRALLDQDRERPLRSLQRMHTDEGWIQGALESNWRGFKIAVVRALGSLAGSDAGDFLIQALSDPVREVRCEAAKVLGTLGDARSIPHLIHALRDEWEWVRIEAAEALGHLRTPVAIGPLVDAYEQDSSQGVRVKAIFALQKVLFTDAAPSSLMDAESAANVIGLARAYVRGDFPN